MAKVRVALTLMVRVRVQVQVRVVDRDLQWQGKSSLGHSTHELPPVSLPLAHHKCSLVGFPLTNSHDA